jgi:DegV family protein with EDD domain
VTVRVVTDSTACLLAPLRDDLGIDVVSLSVNFPGASFREVDISDAEFYERMAASRDVPASSQPTPAEMQAAFERAASAGDDAVGVFLSAEMSGTWQGGVAAAEAVGERHPGVTIEVVDSRSNCMELGFAAIAAARTAAEGGSAAECAEAARHVMARSRFVFVPETLDYLRRGGRIGGASALLGSMLRIRPILMVADGRTEVLCRVRTVERARRELVEQFARDVAAKGLAEVAVHHIHDPEAGAALAAEVAEVAGRPVDSVPIGPVIGLHVGPGTVGLVYVTERPLDAVDGSSPAPSR